MKTSLLLGAALAVLGVAAAPTILPAQTTSTTGYMQTSKIIGTKVKTAQGEEVGVVKDVVIDRGSGCMAYTVLSAGGTGTRITGQAKVVAVPWAVYSPSADASVLTVRVERDKIYNAPVFEYSRMDEYSTTGYINNVYSYYGVSAQVGVSGQTSVTGSAATTTGATTATATPMASTSPSVTAAPTGSTSPAAAAAATAAATASPAATAPASPEARRETSRKESTTGQPKASATPVSPHRHTETMKGEKNEESPAESTTSPLKERGKTSRKRAPEETAEPSVSPKPTQEQE